MNRKRKISNTVPSRVTVPRSTQWYRKNASKDGVNPRPVLGATGRENTAAGPPKEDLNLRIIDTAQNSSTASEPCDHASTSATNTAGLQLAHDSDHLPQEQYIHPELGIHAIFNEGEACVDANSNDSLQMKLSFKNNSMPSINMNNVIPDGSMTMQQKVVMILAYSLRYHIPNVAVRDLLRMINIFNVNTVPSSKFFFDKFFTQKKKIEKHFLCFRCEAYLGKIIPKKCPQCKTACMKKALLRKQSYFLYSPLNNQLKDLIESRQVAINLDCKSRNENKNTLSDVVDGKAYKLLHTKHCKHRKCLTLGFSFDGVSVSNSSKSQVYPIQCKVLELQPKDRDENTLLPLIWFGRTKIPVHSVVVPFVNELAVLQRDGFDFLDEEGKKQNVIVMTGPASCDAIARAQIRNTKRFNASFGCESCLHPGPNEYGFVGKEHKLRTDNNFIEDALEGSDKNPKNGIKGPSMLCEIPNFGLVSHFVHEYQHGQCLGVMKTLFSYWVESKSKGQAWYLGNNLPNMSELYVKITPPNEISRNTRDLTMWKHFKANEWRSFIFYFGMPLLRYFLPKKFYDHFCLFASSLYILNRTELTQEKINGAELALKKFVYSFNELYIAKDCQVTYNIHTSIHLGEEVRNWGPLFATSTFSYEGQNMFLKDYISGTQWIAEQIMERSLLWRSLPGRASLFDHCTEDVKTLFNSFTSSKRVVSIKCNLSEGLQALSFARKITLCNEILVTFQEALVDCTVNKLCFMYNSFHLHHIYFSCMKNNDSQRRNNVACVDGTYYEFQSLHVIKACICKFHDCKCDVIPVLVCKKFAVSTEILSKDTVLGIKSDHIVRVNLLDNILLIPASNVVNIEKCVVVTVKNATYVIKVVNTLESD